MPFATILTRWRGQGRGQDSDRAEQALRTFEAKNAQVLLNLDEDRYVSQRLREELLQLLLGVAVNVADVVEGCVFNFCRAHQRLGKVNTTGQNAVLGHVVERGKTESTLRSVKLGKTPLTRKTGTTGLFVDRILRERDLVGQQSLLGNCDLSKWIMWSFYQARKLDDPFYKLPREKSELVRRLGLRLSKPDVELLLWQHKLEPHQTAHKPTALDAESFDYYRPGGKTRPLSGTDGLPEVVHQPVSSNQLAGMIEVAS
jgi:hypothetical protein